MTQILEKPLPTDFPPFINYWAEVEPDSPSSERVGKAVADLARITLNGANQHSSHAGLIEPSRPLQAEALYRLSGPLNDLDEESLTSMVDGMLSRETVPEKALELKFDTAYALQEIARVSSDYMTTVLALKQSLEIVRAIESHPSAKNATGLEQFQLAILKNDLEQDAIRLKYTEIVQPAPLEAGKYREFERAFAEKENQAIEQYKKMIALGGSEKGIGMLFEWFYILARRHKSYVDENIDTTSVRGATSREDRVYWHTTSGKELKVPSRGNHDAVITSYRPNREPQIDRIQLKAYEKGFGEQRDKESQYDKTAVTVINIQNVLEAQDYTNKDLVVKRMVEELDRFRGDYALVH